MLGSRICTMAWFSYALVGRLAGGGIDSDSELPELKFVISLLVVFAAKGGY